MTRALPAGTPANINETEQQRYWRKTLSGNLPVLRLNPDYPRPPVSAFIRDVESLDVDQSLYQRLLNFCTEQQVSLNVVLLAVFNTLLHRYTGEEDILIGSVASDCRRWSDTKQPICFTNPIALRTHLTGNLDFPTLLSRTAKTLQDANRHRDYPFAKVLETVRAKQGVCPPAIIHNLFALCCTDAVSTETSLQETDFAEVEEYTSQCDIMLAAVADAEKLTISCHYDAELFKAATVIRLLGHYQSLLWAAVSHPETAISALPLLTNAERQQLLVEWNDTKAEYPKDKCLHELFADQVERTPDAVAIVFDEQQVTYREINARANQLAHYLQRLGVQAESLVGLCMERCVDMIVALLGILKAGGAYVPLDPSYPKERLRFIVEDTQTSVVVIQGRFSKVLPEDIAHRVCLDDDWEKIAKESVTNPQSRAKAENLAYVLYTSGSTGVPKGVMVEHRGLVNYLTWCTQAYPITARHGAPLHSSLAFDLTVTSVWAPLLTGRAVHLIDEGLRSEGLAQALQSNTDFSLVKITPAHLQLLSQQLAPQNAAGRTCAFIIGGEELQAEHLAFWQEHAPDTELINEYGPTETVVGCCVYRVPRDTPLQGTIPIGRPIHNTQLYILDASRQPAPIGVVGELYIGGDGVARGYLNRPELTAEKFIPAPFSTRPGARLYRTGDRVRYLPDGNIEFLGRIDQQVKIRGYRIELGEIETVLNTHPAVRSTVVLAREDAPGDKRLVAYIVTTREVSLTVSELRAFLQRTLPEYMVPTVFVLLDALPLTPNGKIDRKALPAPQQGRLGVTEEFVAPSTPLEEIIATVWSEVLSVKRMGIHDNFFELGGHSLLATQVVARLTNMLQMDLLLRDLFAAPTVSMLAQRLQARREKRPVNQGTKVTRIAREQYRVRPTK